MRRKLDKDNRVAEDGVVDSSSTQEPSDLRGDEKNIAILFFLYLLQGIPLGLCGSIPMLLQNRGVSYRQQVCLFYEAQSSHILRVVSREQHLKMHSRNALSAIILSLFYV